MSDLDLEGATEGAHVVRAGFRLSNQGLLHLLSTNPHRGRGLGSEFRFSREDTYQQGQTTTLHDADTG